MGSNYASGTMYNDYDQTRVLRRRRRSLGHDLDGRGDQRRQLRAPLQGRQQHGRQPYGLRRRNHDPRHLPSAAETSIGVSGANVLQAHIGDRLHYHTQAAHKPCTSADKVYAAHDHDEPAGLSKPQIDMACWYTNAKPGPKAPCTTSAGTPPVWDNDSTYN